MLIYKKTFLSLLMLAGIALLGKESTPPAKPKESSKKESNKKEDKKPKKDKKPKVFKPAFNSPNYKKFSIKFAGGTVGELFKDIAKDGHIQPNVIIQERAKNYKIKKFSVRFVNVKYIIETLSQIDDKILFAEDPDSGVISISIKKDPTRSHKVFNIKEYIGTYKISDINNLIRGAWEAVNYTTEGKVFFHKETNILIVVGTPEELQIVTDIIAALDDKILVNSRKK